jgi:sorbitol/mannitol transport system permease protein
VITARPSATAAARPLAARRPRVRAGGTLLTALTYVIALLMFFPILWTVLTGFKTEANAVALPPSLIFKPTLEHYQNALVDANYLSYFVHSSVIGVGSTLLAFLLGVPAAYSLGLFPTRRTPGVLSWVLSTKMLPVVGVLVPLIVLYKQLGLFDTYLGMILLYAAMNLPLVIWMMRSFFAEFPREIIEASQIDGAGFLRTLSGVVLPLVAPGLGATALLCLIMAWNEFFLVVNLTGPRAGTLPVYIASFMTSEGLFWAKMSAAATLAIAPVFIAGWAAQRSLVRGLTMGAVK